MSESKIINEMRMVWITSTFIFIGIGIGSIIGSILFGESESPIEWFVIFNLLSCYLWMGSKVILYDKEQRESFDYKQENMDNKLG